MYRHSLKQTCVLLDRISVVYFFRIYIVEFEMAASRPQSVGWLSVYSAQFLHGPNDAWTCGSNKAVSH